MTDAAQPMNEVFADRYAVDDDFVHCIFGADDDGKIYVWRANRTPTPTPTPSVTPTPSTTPSVTPTPTPFGYKTPSPTPAYCNTALEIQNLEDLWLSHTWSSETNGWRFRVTRASDPDETFGYGAIRDNENIFIDDGYSWPQQEVSLHLQLEDDVSYSIHTGDYITFTYDTGQSVNVYLPAINGADSVYYYVSSNGYTYSDRWLCSLVQASPTCTPVGFETPTPSTAPTTVSAPGPLGGAPPSSPSPVSPVPEPGEGPFDLVGTIEAGSPVWSVWADDRYLYGERGRERSISGSGGLGGFTSRGRSEVTTTGTSTGWPVTGVSSSAASTGRARTGRFTPGTSTSAPGDFPSSPHSIRGKALCTRWRRTRN